jgi:hypothetical protein
LIMEYILLNRQPDAQKIQKHPEGISHYPYL